MRRSLFIACVLLQACERPSPTPVVAHDEVAKSSTVTSPTPTSSATTSSADGFPKLDDACAKDADCDTSPFTGADCCMGCVPTAGARAWVAQAGAYCSSHPPKDCAVFGCAAHEGVAACRAGHCVTN